MNTNYFLISLLFCLFASSNLWSCDKDEDEKTDGTGSSVNLGRDLVLHYTFDEGFSTSSVQTITDYSKSKINGVLNGTPEFVTDTPKGSGYALKLRRDDFINIPSYAIKDSSNVSLSLWVKDFGQGLLFSSYNGTDRICPTLSISSSDELQFQFGESANYSTAVFTSSIVGYQSGGWHMITVTSASNLEKICLFIDGILMDTQSGRNAKCSGTKMQIAYNADPMLIDNVRVYARSLNVKEVSELYNQERK